MSNTSVDVEFGGCAPARPTKEGCKHRPRRGHNGFIKRWIYLKSVLCFCAFLWLVLLTLCAAYRGVIHSGWPCGQHEEVTRMRQELQIIQQQITQQGSWQGEQHMNIYESQKLAQEASSIRIKRDVTPADTSPYPVTQASITAEFTSVTETPNVTLIAPLTVADSDPDHVPPEGTVSLHPELAHYIGNEPTREWPIQVAQFACVDIGDGMLYIPTDRIYRFWVTSVDSALILYDGTSGRFSTDTPGLYLIQLQVMFRTVNRVELGVRLMEDRQGILAECRSRVGTDYSSGYQSCALSQVVNMTRSARVYVKDAFKDAQLPGREEGTFINFILLVPSTDQNK